MATTVKRKPAPFKVGNVFIAECEETGLGDRAVWFCEEACDCWHGANLDRLFAWLARAEAWCKQGAGRGRAGEVTHGRRGRRR